MTWRILHISDLHFCTTPRRLNLWKYAKTRTRRDNSGIQAPNRAAVLGFGLPESYCPEMASFLARKIYSLQPETDLLVISGDVATTGLTTDLRVALKFVDSPATTEHLAADGSPTIRIDDLQVFLLPGNHDRFRTIKAEPGSPHFDLVFEKYWGAPPPPGDSPPIQPASDIRAVILRQPGRDPLALVAADFCLRREEDASTPTRWFRYGQGFAYESVIQKLVEKTSNLRDRIDGIGIVWVLHFPPSDECSGFCDIYALRHHTRVIDAANEHQIKLILAGHIHENKRVRIDDLEILCAGSGCAFGQENGNWMHLLGIQVRGGLATLESRSNYRWTEAAGDFVVA